MGWRRKPRSCLFHPVIYSLSKYARPDKSTMSSVCLANYSWLGVKGGNPVDNRWFLVVTRWGNKLTLTRRRGFFDFLRSCHVRIRETQTARQSWPRTKGPQDNRIRDGNHRATEPNKTRDVVGSAWMRVRYAVCGMWYAVCGIRCDGCGVCKAIDHAAAMRARL